MHFLSAVSLFIFLLNLSSFGSDEKSYSQGEQLSKEKGFEVPSDISKVPGYKDPSAFAKSINKKNIDQASQNASQNSPEDAFLRKTYTTRSRFDLDAESDPLFTDADKVILNPEKILNVRAQTRTFPVGVSRHTCTKGYDLFERKCKWWTTPIKTGVRREEKTYTVHLKGQQLHRCKKLFVLMAETDPAARAFTQRNFPDQLAVSANPQIAAKDQLEAFKSVFNKRDERTGAALDIDSDNITAVSYKSYAGNIVSYTDRVTGPEYDIFEFNAYKEIPLYEHKWLNNCDDLEGQTDTGACEYSEKRCIEGPATKVINGTPVYSKCWAEEAVYQCKTKEEDTCKELAKKGCFQVGSKCLVTLEKGHCVKWQQTYECQSGKRQASMTTLSGDKPFCLDGTCLDQSWDGNGDMIEALSKLAIFKEMQKGLEAKAGIVFKGKDLGCSRVPTGFKDCCKIKGWGQDIKLASCNSEEKELAIQKKLGKCQLIGTYCVDRVLGVCTRKKTTYCCYPSKLSKLINVQGKQQLGLSFGTPKEPQCGGLTLEQISRVDFSKLDLTELFSEIFAGMKTPDTGTLSKDIQKSMANKTYTVNNKPKKITQGRQHGNF